MICLFFPAGFLCPQRALICLQVVFWFEDDLLHLICVEQQQEQQFISPSFQGSSGAVDFFQSTMDRASRLLGISLFLTALLYHSRYLETHPRCSVIRASSVSCDNTSHGGNSSPGVTSTTSREVDAGPDSSGKASTTSSGLSSISDIDWWNHIDVDDVLLLTGTASGISEDEGETPASSGASALPPFVGLQYATKIRAYRRLLANELKQQRRGRSPDTSTVFGRQDRVVRTLWTYWAQGLEQAPRIVRACVSKMRRLNPGWTVEVVTKATLGSFLSPEEVELVVGAESLRQSFSEKIHSFHKTLCRSLLEGEGGGKLWWP